MNATVAGPLHPEEQTVLRLLGAGCGFSQIRRHLYLLEDCETRPAATGRMIDDLVAAGYVVSSAGRVRLTAKGRAAVS